MATEMSKPTRRLLVAVNYLCVVLFLVLYAVGKYLGWSLPVAIALAAVVVILLVSFILAHIKTRLWRLAHTKAENLDERQIQVTHESLRYSYGIFTVISLAILLIIAVISGDDDSMLILIFASLLYLAHTLPSSIIAWTEREI
jgi:uncharacterized membrane protein